ncbi:Hypothetical predicted protein [Olea europaea subsp. europaea]|uniref:Uncharacterized protein n=1 Tax=Olea europaea subsp. europaea TaxID=158383 RepID=A0A8S0U5S3_OLEEU|nr:Hypothetical predicted protein [Olea europaea subsp. europaea]
MQKSEPPLHKFVPIDVVSIRSPHPVPDPSTVAARRQAQWCITREIRGATRDAPVVEAMQRRLEFVAVDGGARAR